MFAKAFTFASLASLASAHMLMANPKPYGKIDNSPLMGDGSDFPCKGAVNDGASANVYEQGSTQQLSFIGQATHGGGSCQISLTTDKNPTKDSVWKVIKSIEGGCPAKGQEGNMGGNADAPDPYKYDFTIPKELAAGDYTLAWTWFNKVGNREMYMNCAAVTIEGSGGSKDHLDSLPDMFVANLGDGCETLHDQDLLFPNPGKNVDKFNGATDAFKGPNDKCTAAPGGGSKPPSPTGGNDAPAPTGGNEAPAPTGGNAQPTQPQVTQPAVTQPAAPGSGDGSSGSPQMPGGGVFITVSQPAASQPAATQPAATQAPEAPAAPETPKTPDNGSGSDSGEGNKGGDSGSGSGGFAAGTACTSEGEWNCIGGSTFQRCASGAWTTTQQLSSGVSCTPGQGADIGMTAKRGARAMRRAARHST
ncbi:related to spore coat protein SP96 precursor [Fusarium torulosum]|uniref:Related to spore coat protein SP96 n=1 Tax=Fusarium torulosum TaxID=33205 RepID=A0AAE8M073_9HYPO|nr:related to spore coat protein SP96 precursor [Fusarium torulosum]